MSRASFFLLSVLLTPQITLTAQADLPSGTRARVTVSAPGAQTTGTEWIGWADRWDGDTLVLRLDRHTRIALPRSVIARIDVMRGRKSQILVRTGIGFLTGAVAGAVIGFMLGGMSGSDTLSVPCEPDDFLCGDSERLRLEIAYDMTRGEAATAGAVVLGTLGTAIGLVSGLIASRARWEPMSLSVRPTLTMRRATPAVGVGMTIEF